MCFTYIVSTLFGGTKTHCIPFSPPIILVELWVGEFWIT